ncbi:uncharacterized protein LOC119078092 isoform X2 [Bradysia coprophila]|nr:uncharacterized protein LOC119078092 isoform X2 [Bradysia coprophila]
MFQKIILVFIILNGQLICEASVADSWILFVKAMKHSWNKCPVDNGAWQCLKRSSLEVFDKMTKESVISLTENVRLIKHRHHRKLSYDSHTEVNKNLLDVSSLSLESWSEHILDSLFNLYDTHTLTIGKAFSEGRRRHRNDMMPMMILSATALGIFVVPIGLQALLIVCGKAILLAKMALLISSING